MQTGSKYTATYTSFALDHAELTRRKGDGGAGGQANLLGPGWAGMVLQEKHGSPHRSFFLSALEREYKLL